MRITNNTKCLSAGNVFFCLTFTAITSYICGNYPHIVGWKCRNCIRFKPLTKTGVNEEVEFLITVWWDSCFCRYGGQGERTEGDWQSGSRAYFPTSASHRAPCPTQLLWRLETYSLMMGKGAADLTAHPEHFHSSLRLNQRLEHASWCSRICVDVKRDQAATDWHVIISNSPFQLKLCCKCQNTSGEMVSKVSLFSASATHSHGFSIS